MVMSKNNLGEDFKELLEQVEKRFSSEEKDSVMEMIFFELLEDCNEKCDHPFNKEYYIYDALSMLLRSGLCEKARMGGFTFDMVFENLIERVENHEEINDTTLSFENSSLFRTKQIASDINELKKDIDEDVMEFEQNFEEDNHNFYRVLEDN